MAIKKGTLEERARAEHASVHARQRMAWEQRAKEDAECCAGVLMDRFGVTREEMTVFGSSGDVAVGALRFRYEAEEGGVQLACESGWRWVGNIAELGQVLFVEKPITTTPVSTSWPERDWFSDARESLDMGDEAEVGSGKVASFYLRAVALLLVDVTEEMRRSRGALSDIARTLDNGLGVVEVSR